MEIQVVDPAAFAVYQEYLKASKGKPSKENPFTFEVNRFSKAAPAERLNQLFAYEAIQDGDKVLSLEEAKKIDEYYQLSHPSLRALLRLDFNFSPRTDPDLEDVIKSTPLGHLEWFVSQLSGADSQADFLAAVNHHPKLATLLCENCGEILAWLKIRLDILKDHPAQRIRFLDVIGEVADIQSFYDPLKFCLAKNREGFLMIPDAIINSAAGDVAKDNPEYQQVLQEEEALLQLAEDQNPHLAKDALKRIAELKIEKTPILNQLINSTDDIVYGAALEALAIWGDDESIQILEDTIRYGGFQQHIMAMFALREYLPTDRLAKVIQCLLEDNDSFVRSAGLKILQFAWHRYGFDQYQDHFRAQVKYLAENDPNKYVRMAAVECIGYSHDPELAAWLDTMGNDTDLIPFIKNAQAHSRDRTAPSGYDGPVDFMSDSYIYPIQSRWIVDALREMARKGNNPLKVLMTGCSFGTEAFSLLMEVMKNYEKNPAAWGDFDPRQDLKIICSDIDTQPLLYAERGYYYFHPTGSKIIDEFNGMRFYHKVYGTDFYHDLGHFFEPVSNPLNGQYRLKGQYSRMLEVRYLDVTATLEEPVAEIVTFNRLDYVWADDPNATMAFVGNIFELSSYYVAYVKWGNPWTNLPLEMFGTPIHVSGPLGFMGKKEGR